MKKEIGFIVILLFLLFLIPYFIADRTFEYQRQGISQKEQQQVKIAYDAVVQMYGISLKVIIEELIEKPEILDILEKANLANTIEKKLLRGLLYRKLYPIYHNKLEELNIRQFHFHLASGESFLRFNDLTSSGDNLFDFRPTFRKANIEKVYASGFEGGRVSPGFRHVFPLFRGEQHLGSVEISLAFEALEKEMSKLMPNMQLMLIMKKSITTDMVFKEHKERFAPYFLSRDYVIENPLISKLNKKHESSFLINKLYDYLAYNPSEKFEIEDKLTYAEPFSKILKLGRQEYYGMHFVPIFDTSNLLSAYIVAHDPEIVVGELENQKLIILILSAIALIIFGVVLYLLAKNREKTIRNKQEIEAIAKTINDGLIVLDRKGALKFINNSACRILGYQEEEILGKIIHSKIHYHDTEDYENCPIINVGKSAVSYAGEEKFIKKSGLVFPVDVSSTPLIEHGESVGSVTIFRDITNQKKVDARVKKMAYYDSLTDVPNRQLFFDELKYTIEKSKRLGLYSGLIYIDLDNFKDINDTFGHQVGDELLQQVASRLNLEIRQEDTLARLGGDEFVIIIDVLNSDLEQSRVNFNIIVNKIYNSFKMEFILNKAPHHCYASIGGLIFKGNNTTPRKLLDKVDKIMYEAKKSGKDIFKIQTY